MDNSSRDVRSSIAANVVIIIAVFVASALLQNGDVTYWRYGPNDQLSVVSVRIDTPARYCLLVFFIMILQALRVYASETGAPIIYFNTFNRDKKQITQFTHTELYVLSVVFYATAQIRDVIFVLISIQQIDIALWIILGGTCMSLFTISNLLRVKTFVAQKTVRAPADPYGVVAFKGYAVVT